MSPREGPPAPSGAAMPVGAVAFGPAIAAIFVITEDRVITSFFLAVPPALAT